MQRIAKAVAAVNRLENFLNSTEMENSINEAPINEKNLIEIEGASAKWSLSCKRDTLSKINLNVINGSITAVIGQVGSGKSSLLHAILRELPLTEGKLRVSGKIAYVSQEAWIFASSIRQNILFGRTMDRKRYEAVINVCQLDHDLAMFPDKDQTLIGEKGQ